MNRTIRDKKQNGDKLEKMENYKRYRENPIKLQRKDWRLCTEPLAYRKPSHSASFHHLCSERRGPYKVKKLSQLMNV